MEITARLLNDATPTVVCKAQKKEFNTAEGDILNLFLEMLRTKEYVLSFTFGKYIDIENPETKDVISIKTSDVSSYAGWNPVTNEYFMFGFIPVPIQQPVETKPGVNEGQTSQDNTNQQYPEFIRGV